MVKILNKFYGIIDKIGKRNFILIIFIFIILMVTGLYQTFSIYTESEGLSIVDGIKTYSFILNANNATNSVTIAAGESKNIDITVHNDSVADLQYKLYSSITSNDESDIFIGYLTNTAYLPEGVISAETSYVVTLKVYNYSENDITINFGVLYGLENAGDLTLSSGQYEIEVLTLMKTMFDTWDEDYNYYRTDEYRNNIVSASFVDLDTTGMTESLNNSVVSWNISANGSNDESVVAWLSTNSTDNTKYDLYIGAKEKIYTDSLYAMFSQMSALKNVDFSNLNTSLATDISFLFRECPNLLGNGKNDDIWVLDLSSFDTSNVTKMWSFLGKCSSLISVDLSSFNTSKVTDMRSMFINCSSLKGIKKDTGEWVLDLSNFNTSNVTTMVQMFEGCSSLEELDLSSFDTSKVTDMQSMFYGCSSLKGKFDSSSLIMILDLRNFDTTNVTNMTNMFFNCNALTNLDLSSFSTTNVTDMIGMFSNCSSLTSLDLSNFDTSSVTNMAGMFNNCGNLISLKLSSFDTSKVTSFVQMFNGCSNLSILNLSNFNTSNATSMYRMFNDCSNLATLTLDLVGFDTSNVISFTEMFDGCSKLSTTIVIRSNVSGTVNYGNTFLNAATASDARILVYYTEDTETLVKNMVPINTSTSHVYAVIELAKMPIGSYVQYVGNNGCIGMACEGQNANYVSDTSKGYCHDPDKQFSVNGWRIAYVNDGSAHLISAGATNCLCTDSDGNPDSGGCTTSLDSLLDSSGKPNNAHFTNMNNVALKYCNSKYAKGGICDDSTTWAMDAVDFQRITGRDLSETSCLKSSQDEACGYNKSLIDNGSYYWYATVYLANTRGAFQWHAGSRFISYYNTSLSLGVRPVLALDPSVAVTGGNGSYSDPYTIIK